MKRGKLQFAPNISTMLKRVSDSLDRARSPLVRMNLGGSSSAANSRGTGVAKGHGHDIFQEFLSHVQFEALNLEDYTVRYTTIPIITIHDHT